MVEGFIENGLLTIPAANNVIRIIPPLIINSNHVKEAEEKIQAAFREIEIQKKAAIAEVKNSVGTMALEIAEKVLRKELKSNNEQVEYVNKLAKESNLN